MGVLAVARAFFEEALTLSRDRDERRAIGERLCELAEQEDFTEYHVLHGTPLLPPPSSADDDAPPVPPVQSADHRHGAGPLPAA